MKTLFAFVVGAAEFVFGTLFAVALTYPAMAGYFSAACSNNGLGWSAFVLLLAPLEVPLVGLVWLAAGGAVAALGRPFHSGNGFWRGSKWLVLGAVGTGLFVWLVAFATGASARCSIGF